MSNNRNDFLESIHVSEESKSNIEKTPFSDIDMYTCLRLMGDIVKVERFLSTESNQDIDEQPTSTSMATNYFYVINHYLGKAEYDFRNGRIDGNEFKQQINQTCSSHNLDLTYLLEITDKIDSLSKEPNQQEGIKLAQEIEQMAIKKHEQRMKQERE